MIRIRGLPWSSCGADVLEVFPPPIQICNGEAGVHFTLTKGIFLSLRVLFVICDTFVFVRILGKHDKPSYLVGKLSKR